jgi:hypothetical protein
LKDVKASRLKETMLAPARLCAPQTPLIAVCRRSTDVGLTGYQAESGLAVFFGPIAPPGNHHRPLADQIAIVVQPKRDRPGCLRRFPARPDRLPERLVRGWRRSFLDRLDAGILAGRFGQFRDALAKGRMLLGHPFRLARVSTPRAYSAVSHSRLAANIYRSV